MSSLGHVGSGLFANPREVVGVTAIDGPGGHAGHFVGVLPSCAGDNVRYPCSAGMQRYPAFGALVDLAPPPVDRPDRREVVSASAEPVFDQLAAGRLSASPGRAR